MLVSIPVVGLRPAGASLFIIISVLACTDFLIDYSEIKRINQPPRVYERA